MSDTQYNVINKVIKLKINHCKECPYYLHEKEEDIYGCAGGHGGSIETSWHHRCRKTGFEIFPNSIAELDFIPNWCPLENTEQQETEE